MSLKIIVKSLSNF